MTQHSHRFIVVTAFVLVFVGTTAFSQPRIRARDLGVPFQGTPGPLNAITDVRGVEVGHATIIAGEGRLEVGKGPIRTGVTAILPRGKDSSDPCFAGWSTLNGNGEMTGTTWVEESGFLEGPVMITNTHSVGVVRDAVVAWQRERFKKPFEPWSLPVVAETWDGWLNDINGFHIKAEHAFEALDCAAGGEVREGNVGGGTGMIVHGFKGGIGTASRMVEIEGRTYVLGVLAQANYGKRSQLTVAGVPVGREITELMPERGELEGGSVIVVAATDAPLLPHQLKRLARRAAIGIGRTGGVGENSSGDIFIAFSTANAGAGRDTGIVSLVMVPNHRISVLFAATVEATEEAVVNAMVAVETMSGVNGNTVYALPHGQLKQVLRKYGRLAR